MHLLLPLLATGDPFTRIETWLLQQAETITVIVVIIMAIIFLFRHQVANLIRLVILGALVMTLFAGASSGNINDTILFQLGNWLTNAFGI